MTSDQMHRPWTDLLKRLTKSSGVSSMLLGRVFARVMLGGGVTGGSVPRAEITRGDMLLRPTPLSPGTVSKATVALRDAGLLTELPKRPGDRGGPIVPLALGSERCAVVGVHVEDRGRQLRVLTGVLARLDGREIHQTEQKLETHDPRDDEAALIDGVKEVVRTLLQEAEEEKGVCVTAQDLLGVGVEIAGHVLNNGDVIFETEVKKSDKLQIGRKLAELLQLPVVVENDLNARAIQALYHRQFKYLDAAMVEVLDEGVGGALIIDGRIYRGGSGMAMELGHLTVEYPTAPLPPPDRAAASDDGERSRGFADACLCDPHAFGHVDALATPARIRGELRVDDIQTAAETLALVPHANDPELYRLSQEGVVFRRAGTALGRGLVHVINIANPSQLLLRLPAALATATPQTSGAQYLSAAENAVNHAFSTGAQDARSGGQRLPVDAVDPSDVAHDGACAAAVAALHRFVEHAVNRDGCEKPSMPDTRPDGPQDTTAPTMNQLLDKTPSETTLHAGSQPSRPDAR